MLPHRRRCLPSLERGARVRVNERDLPSISGTRLRRLYHCPRATCDNCGVYSASFAFPGAYFTCRLRGFASGPELSVLNSMRRAGGRLQRAFNRMSLRANFAVKRPLVSFQSRNRPRASLDPQLSSPRSLRRRHSGLIRNQTHAPSLPQIAKSTARCSLRLHDRCSLHSLPRFIHTFFNRAANLMELGCAMT